MKAALYTMAKTLLVVARTVAVHTTPKAQTLVVDGPDAYERRRPHHLNPGSGGIAGRPEGNGGPLRRRVILTSSQPESDAIVLAASRRSRRRLARGDELRQLRVQLCISSRRRTAFT